MKTCGKCKETKLSSEFFRSSRSVDGLQGYCKDCDRIRKYGINGNKQYSEDVLPYLWDYSATKAAKKFGSKREPESEVVLPYYSRIVKHVKIRDLPQWFCWSCRQWHTSAVERSDCPHCKRPLRQNGQSFSAWRALSI